MSKKPDGLTSKKKAPKVGDLPSKAPHTKGLNRLRQLVPLGMSPKCRKVFFPRGMK